MEKTKTLALEIAILGGGFAGVYCGQSLLKQFGRRSKTRIGLISDENYMVFQPMLPEVVSASLSPRHVVNPIRHLCRGIEAYKAEVEEIDVKNRQLTLRPGPFSREVVVRFRHLVVALGAKIDLSRVPGMSEHAFLMQNVGDAMKLRAAVLARFEEANLVTDPDHRRRLLTFVVVGGGYSGVETAGQILDLFIDINQFYSNVGPEAFHVFLVHSREHLLPTLSQSLGEYAKAKLRARGLKLSLGRRVKAVTANQVVLDDGSFIESNTVISTIGNAPHPLIRQLAEDTGAETVHGRIKTADTLQVPGHDWLWAAGDGAAVPMPDGDICPSTAQFAMRQGRLLGKNISASLRAEDTKPFAFTGLGELAAIGHRTAVAEILGLKFSGFFAWWMWRTIYLSKLPGLDRKLRVVIDWTLDLVFPRDINLLNPRYSRNLKQEFLSEGDVLFRSGEPAFSFYVVKSGSVRLTDDTGHAIKTVRAGDFFGERALLSDHRWRFNATAAEPTQLIGLGSKEFEAILESSKGIRRLLQCSADQYRSNREIEGMLKTLPDQLLQRKAGSLMTEDPVTICANDGITETLKRFNRERHSFYPVKEPDSEQLRGVLAREDFYHHVQINGLPKDETVFNLALTDLPRVSPNSDIRSCIKTMTRAGNNKLLVMEGNQLKGLLSIRDVLAAAVNGDETPGASQPDAR